MAEQQYDFHPAAALFPLMTGEPFEDLCTDLKENGLQEPIWLHEGRILDGRNRFMACQKSGVQPEFREYVGDRPYHFVISQNLRRRHLSVVQRLNILESAKPQLEAEARKRQAHGQTAPGRTLRADLPQALDGEPAEHGKVTDQIGDLAGVSGRTVRNFDSVNERGAPELVDAMKTEKVPVSTAAEIAKLPMEAQKRVVAKAKNGQAKGLRRAIQEERALDAAKGKLLDGLGKPVADHLIGAFSRVPEFRAIIREICEIRRKLEELRDSPAGVHLRVQPIWIDLKNAKVAIRFSMPYVTCPFKKEGVCRSSCEFCRGNGWLTESQYNGLPRKMRA